MSKTISVLGLLVFGAVVLAPSPGRACMSAEDIAAMQANRALAAQNHCEDVIVRPSGIGAIYVGESAEDALKAAPASISFEIAAGKVVRVRHTAQLACVQTNWLTPLRVVTMTSPIQPIDGIAITRDREGVHVSVQRAS